MIRLLSGDARDVLPTLPAESVQCVVTSPPYYGLRDYGTALWDGGDAGCDHKDRGWDINNRVWFDGGQPRQFSGGKPVVGDCPRCGAVRVDRQIGLEATPDAYIQTMVGVFREVRRVLRRDGTCWVNMGDSYAAAPSGGFDKGNRGGGALQGGGFRSNTAFSTVGNGYKPKDLLLMPARLALALQADGWWVRSDIIWHKPNPMPESCRDRPTSTHEHVFLLTRSARYYYDAQAVSEPSVIGDGAIRNITPGNKGADGSRNDGDRFGVVNNGSRNLRNVWTIATHAFSGWSDLVDLVPVPVSEVPELDASASAIGGDIARITSPDCPSHAAQPDSVPKGFYDGLSAEQLRSIRDTGDRPAQDMPLGSSTTRHIPVRSNSLPSMRDCSDLEDAAFATPHSTESHRTGHGPLFSERAISCAETDDGRLRTAPSPSALASTCRDTEGCKTEGDNEGGPAPETAAGNSHTSGSLACRCGYYRKVTTKTSHFATFPPELAERCIKAGTSERGCCAACGKPWQRITERVSTGKSIAGPKSQAKRDAGLVTAFSGYDDGSSAPEFRTTGWSPGCDHDAPTVPCTVLDPFAGAGTTLLVADRLQRDAIGIELNTAYTEMAMERCRADAPLFTSFPPAEPPEESRMGDLFAGDEYERTVPAQKPMQVPRGWDTGPGAHGTIHRTGRTMTDMAAD